MINTVESSRKLVITTIVIGVLALGIAFCAGRATMKNQILDVLEQRVRAEQSMQGEGIGEKLYNGVRNIACEGYTKEQIQALRNEIWNQPIIGGHAKEDSQKRQGTPGN
jgi:hypothetical protein